MRTQILASLAFAATLFTACSENATPPPSKAQVCASGLTADCLMGTWSTNGPIVPRIVGTDTVDIVSPTPDFSANPATLRFYVDEKNANKFEFINSSLTIAPCQNGTGKIYGSWDIQGNYLHLRANIGNICLQPNDEALVQTVVSTDGVSVSLKLKKLFFLSPELDLGDEKNPSADIAIEKYTFVSEN